MDTPNPAYSSLVKLLSTSGSANCGHTVWDEGGGFSHHGQDDESLHGADAVEEQHDYEHEAHQGPEEWDVHQCLPTPVCRGKEPRDPQLGTSLCL